MSKSKPLVECFEGEWRRPVNDLQHQDVGGDHKAIHDDATARSAGFAGAPIHGTVHWSQFTPLLLKVFGKRWFETGTISVIFKTVVTNLQPVKAFIEKPCSSRKQVMVWMEHINGRLVMDGTASIDNLDAGVTMVDKQLQKIKPVTDQLVFIPYPIGTKTEDNEEAQINWGETIGPLFPFTLDKKLEIITEWHPWFSKEYGENSPWGRPILPPESLNQILFCSSNKAAWPRCPNTRLQEMMDKKTPVGLFGGCEVKLFGPCFVGEKYFIEREIIAVGETPRTEFRWTKAIMRTKTGTVIAEMTLQEMFLKGTIQNYDELRMAANGKHVNSKL